MKNKCIFGVLALSLLSVPCVQSAEKDCGAAAVVARSAEKIYTITTKNNTHVAVTQNFINQFKLLTDFLSDDFEDDNTAVSLPHVTPQDIDFLQQIIDADTQEAMQNLLDPLSLQKLIHITHLAVNYLGIQPCNDKTRYLDRADIMEDFLAQKLWTPQEGVDAIQHYDLVIKLLSENPSGYEPNICYKQLKNLFLTIRSPQLVNTIRHARWIESAQFSPDGRFVVTASADNTAHIVDTHTGTLIHRITHAAQVWAAQFSPDGRSVVTASEDGTAHIVDTHTGALIYTITHTEPINSAQFSPDGRFVVTASNDNTAKIYDTHTGTEIHRIAHTRSVNSAQFSPDGRFVVTASNDNTAKIYDTETRTVIHRITHTRPVNSAQFSPDGRFVVTASDDNTAQIYDTYRGTVIHRITHDHRTVLSAQWRVWSAQFSPDGRSVVTASGDHTAHIVDTHTGTLIHIIRHDDGVNSAQFSPDGRYVVTASYDGTAKIYDTYRCTVVHTITHDHWRVWSAQFSPDGRSVVTASEDGTAQIYDFYTEQQKDVLDNEKKLRKDKIMYSSIDILRLRQQEELRQQEQNLAS